MAGSPGDLTIAMRVRASVNQARAALGEISAKFKEIGASAAGADTGAQSASLGLDSVTASANRAAGAVDRANASIAATAGVGAGASLLADAHQNLNEHMGRSVNTMLNQHANIIQVGRDYEVLDGIMAGTATSAKEIGDQELALDRLMQAGAITAAQQSAALEALTAQEEKLGLAEGEAAAAAEAEALSFSNSNSVREETVLLDELLQHRYHRMSGSLLNLARYSGSLGKIMSPLGLSILGVVGAAAAFVGVTLGIEDHQAKINRLFLQTGDALGMTRGEFDALPYEMENGVESVGKLSSALMAVAATGEFSGERLKTVSEGVAAMSELTGQKTKQVVKVFDEIGKDPVRSLAQLNLQYHFLTQATFDQIAALAKQGKMQEASRLEQDLLAKSMKTRAREALEEEGYLLKAAHSVGDAFSKMWNKILHIGAPATLEERLKKVKDELSGTVSSHGLLYGPLATNVNPATGARRAELLKEEKRLEAQIGEEKKKAEQRSAEQLAIQKEINRLEKETGPSGSSKSGLSWNARVSEEGIAMRRQEQLAALQLKKQGIAQELALGQISSQQQLEQLRQLEQQKFEIELKALEDRLALQKPASLGYKQVTKQIEALALQHQAAMQQINNKMVLDTQKSYMRMFSVVTDAVDQSVKGMIRGTTTWRNAERNLFQSILGEFIDMEIKKLSFHVASQIALTGATAAGESQRVAIKTAADKQSLLSTATTVTKQILMKMWAVMTEVYSAIAGIPYVGPFLAPAMAIAAGALVASWAGRVASASGGWWEIPQDQMAMVHKQEMVLPAREAEGIRNLVNRGGSAGGGNHYHFHTMDAESFRDYAIQNRHILAEALGLAGRDGAFA